MAGELFFILLAIFILIIILYLNKKRELYNRKQYLDELKKAGYEVSKELITDINAASLLKIWNLILYTFISRWEIIKDGITFSIWAYSTGGQNRVDWFEISFQMPKQIKEKFSLKIERRGFFSKLFGFKKGQYNYINNEFSIIGSNILLVKYLLNNPKNLKELREASKYKAKFDLNRISKVIIKRYANLLTKTCDEIIDLVNVFKGFIKEIEGDGHYTIQEILSDFDDRYAELNCVICYQPVLIEEVLIFDCCSTVGHENHLKEWLEQKKICPYCKKKNFTLLDPINA